MHSKEMTSDEISSRVSDVPNSDKKTSNAMMYVIGVGLVCMTAVLAVLGGKTAISSLNRNAAASVAEIQQSVVDNMQAKMDSQIEKYKKEASDAKAALKEEQAKISTDQMKWAVKNHITWNENGIPVDESGTPVDDPTTEVNEVERAETMEWTAKGSTVSITSSPVAEAGEKWWEGNPMITEDADGNPVHIVVKGDSLSSIAEGVGYSVDDLCKYNNLSRSSILSIGQVIKIPLDNPNIGLG